MVMVNSSHVVYSYLREKCPTLSAAKRWVRKWYEEMEQVIPGEELDGEPFSCSMRAMAYHVSKVLEGHLQDPTPPDKLTSYIETRYGPALFWAMNGVDD
jgi:hypothetical protein